MQRYMDFVATKRGLAAALHSGDPAYSALPGYFDKRLRPALETLLEAAVAAGVVRPGIEADDLLRAVATLCHGPHGEEPVYARRMVELLVDGLRYGASTRTDKSLKPTLAGIGRRPQSEPSCALDERFGLLASTGDRARTARRTLANLH